MSRTHARAVTLANRAVVLPHCHHEGAPRTNGHAQRVTVAVLGVAHHHGAGGAGDFYALAAVGT
jgi:hypothetical protein